MSAEDIKFPPAERRSSRRFEVPPWEQDQFEELQRKRGAEPPLAEPPVPRSDSTLTPDEAPADVAGAAAAGPEPGSPEPAPGDDWADSAEGAFGNASGDAGQRAGGVDDRAMNAMLAELAVQEESGEKSVKVISIVSGALLVVIGCVLLVWAVAAFVASRRAGAVGTFGGMVLMMFGAGFVAGGVWIGTKHLR